MVRAITGFTPTGQLHLGSYLGAIRPVIDNQHRVDTVVVVADLHALTVPYDPATLRRLSLEIATLLLAAGLDPDTALLYIQSQVPAHTGLPRAMPVRELTDPGARMGRSASSATGALYLLDPPEVLRHKVMRAVTDTGAEVRYDPAGEPGVSNLLELLAACVRDEPSTMAGLFTSYRELKEAVADTVVSVLRPIQQRYADFAADPEYVQGILRDGARRAAGYGGVALPRSRSIARSLRYPMAAAPGHCNAW